MAKPNYTSKFESCAGWAALQSAKAAFLADKTNKVKMNAYRDALNACFEQAGVPFRA